MLSKEQLIRDLLAFTEKRRRTWFTKEEFLVYMYHKYRGRVSFETILRKLRTLARQGVIDRKYKRLEEWGFPRKAVYILRRNTARILVESRSARALF